MGFYNMATGDEPTMKKLARHYSMSDNFHQAVYGGTGANHIVLGAGQDAFYQDANGNATTPPQGEIENPNPQPGTNNFYTQDGYGKSGTTNGGSHSDCADHSAPGVSSVFGYLNTLSYKVANLCAPGHYYLLNNYNPGYNGPAAALAADDRRRAVGPRHLLGLLRRGLGRRQARHGTLPAVSFLKPGDDDGHPGYSTMPAFEEFVSHAIDQVQSSDLWKDTAIIVTFDEGGGYYDSGYIQPVSFFGDGTRIPAIVVSPYAKPGYVSHTYTDHVPILKFIERNWQLPPLSKTSLDNLPDPKTSSKNPYVPINPPAIGDLFDYFDWGHASAAAVKTKARRANIPGARLARRSDLAR